VLAAEFLYVQILCEEQRLHYPHQTEQKFVENKKETTKLATAREQKET
jgi:hypothetical protein